MRSGSHRSGIEWVVAYHSFAVAVVFCCLGQSCQTASLPESAGTLDEQVLADRPEGANATLDFNVVSEGLTLNFVAVAKDGQPLPAGRYSWEFGDGNSGEGSQVSHTYRIAGTYAVAVCVGIGAGATGYYLCSDKPSIEVTGSPVASNGGTSDPTGITGETGSTGHSGTSDQTGTTPSITTVLVTGRVLNGQIALAGVTLDAGTGTPSVLTDSNGSYELTVPIGWSGILTPQSSVYSFNPSSRSLSTLSADLSGQDFSVTSANSLPVANASTAITMQNKPVLIQLSGSDAQSSPLSFSVVVTPAHGTLGNLTVMSATTATVLYTPSAGYAGSDSFSYTASDGVAVSTPASVNVNMLQAPTIQASPSSGAAPLSVTFSAMEDGVLWNKLPAGSALQWNFGDGSASVMGNPVSHVFTSGGSYSVTLSAVLPDNVTISSFAQVPIMDYAGNGSYDANGWTIIEPSSDTRTVYVSDSIGNDSNDGLSSSGAVKTLPTAMAKMRNGMPDHLLLKRGDVFTTGFGNWQVSGRSSSEPMLIASFGVGPRPIVDAQTLVFSQSGSFASHIFVVGIASVDSARDPQSPSFSRTTGKAGLWWFGGNDILIEDCLIKTHSSNMNFQGIDGPLSNIRIRRNIITDAYELDSIGHSQGLFLKNAHTVLIEENIIDHNGWNSAVTGAQATMFNHNIYIQGDCSDVVLRRNIIANASSHGAQLRPGTVAEDNLFVHNPIGLLIGGDSVRVSGNVVLEGNDLDGSPRAWGIDVNPGNSALVENNIIAHEASAGTNGHGIYLVQTIGATVKNNIIYSWKRPLYQQGDTGTTLLDNDINGTGYQDPNRSVASYNGSVGGATTLDAFLQSARLQSKSSWNINYTALAVNNYIRAGFSH